MLGTDKSQDYCLEMICAVNLDGGDPQTLLLSMTRFFRFLPSDQ